MNFIVNESKEKLRGGYYTPEPLAAFITRWVLSINPRTVLEPSCGDGVFINALKKIDPTWKGNFTGIELEEEEAAKSSRVLSKEKVQGKIVSGDFLNWYLQLADTKNIFDAVIGNPPFIRYQYLPEEMKTRAEAIFSNLGLKFTRHTNAWIPFVLASIDLLCPGGRLGMIIPTEIFNVIYAQSLRSHLAATCRKILILDPEDIWFESTLQGAVILLAEKKVTSQQQTKGLAVVRTKGLEFTNENPEHFFEEAHYLNGRTISSKWTYAFLSPRELALYSHIEGNKQVRRFSDVADVDVGIVTGANSFFLVDQATVVTYGLEKFAHPMFGRSEHCPGVIYNKKTHEENVHNGLPAFFIWIPSDPSIKLTPRQKKYISNGEAEGLHKRYKCRIRSPWYTVPSVYTTAIGMLKRSHDCPRLILNQAKAYTTDTAYRVSSKGIDPAILVYSFTNSLTALSAELEGRTYGGGVLELVPSEIERLLIPIALDIVPDLRALDKRVRASPPMDYLPTQDASILSRLELSKGDILLLQGAWDRLRKRRQRQ